MINKYSINIAWSDEDDCFVAIIPEFPLLSAFGDTQEEAIADAKVVLSMTLESLKEDGITPPQPKVVEPHGYSGQVRLRMPACLHETLVKAAGQNGVSMNTYMVSLLSQESSMENVYRRAIDDLSSLVESQTRNFSSIVKTIGEQAENVQSPITPWVKKDSYMVQNEATIYAQVH